MDYGKLLSRTWNIIWDHKFLILLGVLVALSGSGSSGASTGSNLNFRGPDLDFDAQPPQELPELPELPEFPELGRGLRFPVLPVAGVLALVGVLLVIGLAVWVVSTIARGGLIAGASAIDAGVGSTFSQAWSAGWHKGWTLLGIGILPAIPALILFVGGLGLAGAFAGLRGLLGENLMGLPNATLIALFGGLACIAIPIALVLNLLRTFANRACMLEDLGVFAAYRRGFSVLVENIGPALVLFLIQVAISIGLGVAMILSGILMALCCVLWPVLLLIQGAIASYFSTMWTLAWRQWTGVSAPDVAVLEPSVAA